MKLLCNFSANDNLAKFTEGKIYFVKENIIGFNHLRTHINADDGKSFKVETSGCIKNGSKVWVIKDYRSHSVFMNYASFTEA